MCGMFGAGIVFKWAVTIKRLFKVILYLKAVSERQTPEFVIGSFQQYYF